MRLRGVYASTGEGADTFPTLLLRGGECRGEVNRSGGLGHHLILQGEQSGRLDNLVLRNQDNVIQHLPG